MTYIGKSHNLWHRVTLALEKLVTEQSNAAAQNKIKRELDCYDFEPEANPQQVYNLPCIALQWSIVFFIEYVILLPIRENWSTLMTLLTTADLSYVRGVNHLLEKQFSYSVMYSSSVVLGPSKHYNFH